MPDISPDIKSVFDKSDSVAWRVVGGETVFVPVCKTRADLDSIYVLNETGSRIWELLDGARTFDQILNVVIQEYDVGRTDAGDDLRALLAELRDINAIEETLK